MKNGNSCSTLEGATILQSENVMTLKAPQLTLTVVLVQCGLRLMKTLKVKVHFVKRQRKWSQTTSGADSICVFLPL